MTRSFSFTSVVIILVLLLTALFACNGVVTQPVNDKLQVLATTSIVGDVVAQVGGEHIQVTVLLPLGADPHAFEPRPRDAAAIVDADIVFANGAGLEEFLQPLLESADSQEKLIEVSTGIALLALVNDPEEHGGKDPHIWMDPNNVVIWTENISTTLSAVDPEHAADYKANAENYAASLADLDAWIRSQVAQVAPENRLLVTDHGVFGYFANEYGFTQVGTITGSFSTNAAPSARELSALEDDIRSIGVKAVFVGETANDLLARQVAQDTGIKVVTIYHASLTDANGQVPSYLEFMRYNVNAIVTALK